VASGAEVKVGTFGALLANSEDGVLTPVAGRIVSNRRSSVDGRNDDGSLGGNDRMRSRSFGFDGSSVGRNRGSSRTSDFGESVSSRMEFGAEVDAEPE